MFKRAVILGILCLFLAGIGSLCLATEKQGKTYNLSLPAQVTEEGGTTAFIVEGRSGVTAIDKIDQNGRRATVQVDVAGTSIYTFGQTGTTTYEGVVFDLVMYQSNFLAWPNMSAASPVYLMQGKRITSGDTGYAISLDLEPAEYTMFQVVSYVSPFYTMPLKVRVNE